MTFGRKVTATTCDSGKSYRILIGITVVTMHLNDENQQRMGKFIELTIADEDEIKVQIINRDCIGRIYASPQNSRRSIVELNYHSISDAPVYLEVEMPFERLRLYFIE